MNAFLPRPKRQSHYQAHLAATALTMPTNSCHITKKQNQLYLVNSSIPAPPPAGRYPLTFHTGIDLCSMALELKSGWRSRGEVVKMILEQSEIS
ncbi:hypothetical protein L218DRAFT_1009837 [Marasmius fiardii PR-910]|nr:hypothetical protein L218DRAFT_1009837 [Marasmius fiardii PR-910]